MDFDEKCALCNKERGAHKAKTLHCPFGTKTKVGYISYHPTDTFVPKKRRKSNVKSKTKQSL